MKLKIERANVPIPGTKFRPLVRDVTYKNEQVSKEQLRDILASTHLTEIGVEDPYKRGRLMRRFVIDNETLAIAHESSLAAAAAAEVGELAVVHGWVKLHPTVKVGRRSEILAGGQYEEGVEIGDWSTLHKRDIIKQGGHIGSLVFTGQDFHLGAGSSVGTGTTIGRNSRYGKSMWIGTNVRNGEGTRVGSESIMDDSVITGDHVRIADKVTIGEAATISHFTTIKARLIGAYSVIGEMGLYYPTAYVEEDTRVVANEYVSDHFDFSDYPSNPDKD